MERFTYRDEKGLTRPTKIAEKFLEPDDGSNACRLLSKIGEYEDKLELYEKLEEAFKNGIYIETDRYGKDAKNGLRYFDKIYVIYRYVMYSGSEIQIGIIHHSMWKGDEIVDTRKLSDYKKTWWLKEDKSE